MKRVLVLGAGLVAKPLVDTLGERGDVRLVVADLDTGRADGLVAPYDGSSALALDVGDGSALGREVAAADAVVSLLPAPLHPRVAQQAVAHGTPLVTTSYVSDEMAELDGPARERGVLLLNECGLDPGIDHMMAMEIVHRVEARGGAVESYVSFCGGLPAPESNDNPWGYKLSWTPRGALVAARSPVRFRRRGETIENPTPYLADGPEEFQIPGVGLLEGYPNRDSTVYGPLYGIDGAETLLRGTLRYPGWCDTMEALLKLGMLDVRPATASDAATVAGLLARRLPTATEGATLRERFADHLDLDPHHPVLDRFEWLGLFSGRPLPQGPETPDGLGGPLSPLDVLAHLFAEKLPYRPPERDMIVLEHRFRTREADGSQREIVARLVTFGEAGDDSAMAQTVGIPAALACGMILDGRLDLTGVRIPIHGEIYQPILADLRQRGLEIEETERMPD